MRDKLIILCACDMTTGEVAQNSEPVAYEQAIEAIGGVMQTWHYHNKTDLTKDVRVFYDNMGGSPVEMNVVMDLYFRGMTSSRANADTFRDVHTLTIKMHDLDTRNDLDEVTCIVCEQPVEQGDLCSENCGRLYHSISSLEFLPQGWGYVR